MRILRWTFFIFVAMLSAADPRPTYGVTIFSDDFTAGASAQWGNEVGSWSSSSGVYDSASPTTFPNARTSLPFGLTNFTIELDINNVRDGGVWLRSVEAPGTSIGRRGVLLVTGGHVGTGTGLYWHVVTNGNAYGPELIETTGLFVPGVTDPHLRIVVNGDTYTAFVGSSNSPATFLTSNAFTSGSVALYDFSNQTFDNVVLSVPSVPEPSPLSLLMIALASVVMAKRQSLSSFLRKNQ